MFKIFKGVLRDKTLICLNFLYRKILKINFLYFFILLTISYIFIYFHLFHLYSENILKFFSLIPKIFLNCLIFFFRHTQFTMASIQLQQPRNFHSSLRLSTTMIYWIGPFALESSSDPGTFWPLQTALILIVLIQWSSKKKIFSFFIKSNQIQVNRNESKHFLKKFTNIN